MIGFRPWWYEGPDFEKQHQLYAQDRLTHMVTVTTSSFSEDLNKDGWDDILVLGFLVKMHRGLKIQKVRCFWTRHQVMNRVDNDSTFVDIIYDDHGIGLQCRRILRLRGGES